MTLYHIMIVYGLGWEAPGIGAASTGIYVVMHNNISNQMKSSEAKRSTPQIVIIYF